MDDDASSVTGMVSWMDGDVSSVTGGVSLVETHITHRAGCHQWHRPAQMPACV